ncbi:ATP-binding cassette domain-containing protein [Virgibacillus halodenitrificans]|nr:ATP-binding cassette domain-containing protein [Virgibacillus halodenitrificans]
MDITYILLLQIGLTIINNVISKIDQYLSTYVQLNLELEIKAKISNKILDVNYEKLEDHEFYNLIQRTQGDLGSQFLGPVNNVLEISRAIISTVTIFFFLLQFHYLFVAILVLFSIPLFIMQNKFGKDRYVLTKYLTPFAREQNYIFGLFTDRKYNKEIRVNRSFDYLFKKWRFAYSKNSDEVLKQQLSQSKKLLVLEIVSSATFASSFFLILFLLTRSSIRIGDFVSIVEAVQRVLGSISGLSYMTSSLKESVFYLRDIYSILEIPEKNFPQSKQQVELEYNNVIEVKNLNFKYPFMEKNVLKEINLEIEKDSTIMIVGSNGSGKSTLIKCLIGLYNIPEDTISLFGKDITSLSDREIYQRTSVIYQDFGTYEFTAYENILLGDSASGEQKVMDSAVKADIHNYIDNLDRGYETRLGRLFEGSKDLSGGQWQKIALARSILRDSELIILDEPTSSLDPIAERNLFLKFKSITEGKTSIYISHRMYACHLADNIIVLDDGRIVEKGTHSQLLAKKGHYANLYNNQSEMYKETNREMDYEYI